MRLLKAQSTNLRNIYGKGVKYDVNDQVIMDSTNTVLVPKGTTAERPTSPVNGHLRYNTDDDRFEIYEQLQWYGVRVAAPSTGAPIHQQNLGNGDATITLFGPLDSQDANPLYTAPAAAVNVLVLVENVFQISTTNYTLVQNPSSTGTGQEVESGNFVTSTEYIITATGSTDYVSEHGAADNNPGTVFTAASAGTADPTGLARPTGYYLEFTSAPDLGKPVTAIHNFDK
jgi:hypothetical protein